MPDTSALTDEQYRLKVIDSVYKSLFAEFNAIDRQHASGVEAVTFELRPQQILEGLCYVMATVAAQDKEIDPARAADWIKENFLGSYMDAKRQMEEVRRHDGS